MPEPRVRRPARYCATAQHFRSWPLYRLSGWLRVRMRRGSGELISKASLVARDPRVVTALLRCSIAARGPVGAGNAFGLGSAEFVSVFRGVGGGVGASKLTPRAFGWPLWWFRLRGGTR